MLKLNVKINLSEHRNVQTYGLWRHKRETYFEAQKFNFDLMDQSITQLQGCMDNKQYSF